MRLDQESCRSRGATSLVVGEEPLLAGACADPTYAAAVKASLLQVWPSQSSPAIIVDSFLSPEAMAAIYSRTVLNFHPAAYEAYGMTIIEAAAFGVPSVVNRGGQVGATALFLEEKVSSNSCCLAVEFLEKAGGDDTNNGYGNNSTAATSCYCGHHTLSPIAIATTRGFLQDLALLQEIGQRAQKRALAWDETAYGSTLFRHLLSAIECQS